MNNPSQHHGPTCLKNSKFLTTNWRVDPWIGHRLTTRSPLLHSSTSHYPYRLPLKQPNRLPVCALQIHRQPVSVEPCPPYISTTHPQLSRRRGAPVAGHPSAPPFVSLSASFSSFFAQAFAMRNALRSGFVFLAAIV